MPDHIEPMLSAPASEVPASPDYIFENNWDGERMLAFLDGDTVKLTSASGADCTEKYPRIAAALREMGRHAIIDGEVVVLDEDGRPDPNAADPARVKYCMFDLLWLEGNDLMDLPLGNRKAILQTLCQENEVLMCSETFEDGYELYQSAIDNGFEGIVARDRYSSYVPGGTGEAWLKLSTRKQEEEPEVQRPAEASVVADEERTPAPNLTRNSLWKQADASLDGQPVHDFPVENGTIPLHDMERELWKGISKVQLVSYYQRMLPFILPYIKDRPQRLHLHLSGASSKPLVIEDMENRQPEFASVFTEKSGEAAPGERSGIDYLVCNNEQTLLYMIDAGCVDLHPRASRIHNPHSPDYMWLDLHPMLPDDDDQGFAMAVEVAMAAHQALRKSDLEGFVKTSGKAGLHIYIPWAEMDFAQAAERSAELAEQIHKLVPDLSTLEKAGANGKIFINAGLNAYGQTLAAPYCVRPYHEPLVSTPLEWKEIKPGLDRYDLNMKTIEARLAKKGDLFYPLLVGK